MTGARFVMRWSIRVLRREWRQHAVILALLILGVAVAVTGALTAYNMAEPSSRWHGNGDFAMSANDPDQLEQGLTAQGARFGRIAETEMRRGGTTELIVARQLDPTNTITAPLLALLEGRYPTNPGEVAITDGALLDRPAIGSTIDLDGQSLTVVGRIENPMALSDRFVLVSDLASFPSGAEALIEFYVVGREADLDFNALPSANLSEVSSPSKAFFGLLSNVIGAFGMLLIGLLVSASFAVVAMRRSRQYGLLAAAGASPKLIRLAATISGVIVGLVGAILGALLGLALASVLVPSLESQLDYRIDFEVPASVLLPNALLAVGVAAMASLRPASALSRLSIVGMLSSTRPKPRPVGRAAMLGLVLAGLGIAALIAGFRGSGDALPVIGVVLAPVGLLLLAPFLVLAIGRIARRLPLAERLAGRSVARYNRRSASVVAALALALAIPVGIAVVSQAVDQRSSEAGPNLNDRSLILWAEAADAGFAAVPVNIDEAALERRKDAIQEAVPGLTFAPIQALLPPGALENVIVEDGPPMTSPFVALQPLDAECTFCNLDSYGFGDGENYEATIAWLASPELLGAVGLDDAWLDSGALAFARNDAFSVGWYEGITISGEEVATGEAWPAAHTLPSVFLSPRFVDAEDHVITTIGWFAVGDQALTGEQRQAVRDARAGTGVLEFQDIPEPKSTLRTVGFLIGAVIGLGITASAVTLLSVELAHDTALLASLGARPQTGRRMAAAVAGLLALAGALLGTVIGYVPLLPMVASRGDNFSFVVPVPFLLGLLIVFPLLAAAIGWFTNRTAADGTKLRESL